MKSINLKSLSSERDLGIDAVRAISLLIVVLYHLKIKEFLFGFVGVDAFIYISGYLSARWRGNQILPYLCARILRITPELTLVLIFVSVLGFLFQVPTDTYYSLSFIYLVFFGILNSYFAINIGYFGGSSELTSTLHLWSLSVEILCYASFISLVLAQGAVRIISVAIISVIIATDIYISGFSYLSALPRVYVFWQGYLTSLAIHNHCGGRKASLYLLAINSTLMFSLVYIIGGSTYYPYVYWYSLSPLVFMIIHLISRRLMEMSIGHVLMHISSRSYSAYLVHWPIICFHKTLTGNVHLNKTEIAALLVFICFSTEALHFAGNSVRSYINPRP